MTYEEAVLGYVSLGLDDSGAMYDELRNLNIIEKSRKDLEVYAALVGFWFHYCSSIRRKGLAITRLMFLLIVCGNEDGVVRVKQETMADFCGKTRRTIVSWLKLLRWEGLVFEIKKKDNYMPRLTMTAFSYRNLHKKYKEIQKTKSLLVDDDAEQISLAPEVGFTLNEDGEFVLGSVYSCSVR